MTTDGNDYAIDDPAELELTLRAEDAARQYAEEFVADLIDDAGHTLRLEPGDYEGVIRELAATLYHAGFDPQVDPNEDAVAWSFAGPEVYHELEAELAEAVRLTETPPVTVAGHLPVWVDPALPERVVVMIHRDAVIPAPPGDVTRPWIVAQPDGVAVAEVGE